MVSAPTLPEPNDDTGGPLTRLVEAAARGDHSAVEQILAAHPDQATELRANLQRLDQLGLIAPAPEQAPQSIGPYKILGLLGRGGMGSVYLAEQLEPVHRRVALKVIKLGMDSGEVLARFQSERQALALMNHECIARVFDAGATARGQPYFAMEHVPGVSITEHCDKFRLNIAERLHLFQKVCAGVQHAHQKGIIHRDLKPSNILVTTTSGEATPKIIDFGIARATDSHSLAATVFTEQGMILGTPEYMSPEQADGRLQDIDTRTDIYSLGVILYELLAGDLPFPTDDLRAAGLQGLLRKIREEEPPKPSTRVKTRGEGAAATAERRRSSTAALGRALRGDLDWIVMRALDRDRSRRYGSAAAFADDIARHLTHEPVTAGPPSASYRLRKLVRRYRAPLLAAALILAALTLGLGLATKFWFEAREQARDAEAARGREAEKVREFDQLAGVVLLEQAIAKEKELHPPWPQRIPAMRRWLAQDAEPLRAMRTGIERTLAELQRRVPVSGEPAELDASLSKAQQFLSSTLQQLVAQLAKFETDKVHSVRQRLAWAERIQSLTRSHPRARVTWTQAREAIAKADGIVASERYATNPIDLEPQTGLVPIGMNPVTKLWEFYELFSAWDGEGDPAAIPIPQHVADGDRAGHIAVGDDTGIIFVLLPGGTISMGSQAHDASAPYYDPQREVDEELHAVTLSPFYLARHELTQAQWRRLSSGELPSGYRAGSLHGGQQITWANPVEQVDWSMCDAMLSRHGLVLPTEAQWEYACRAGTTTPWWTGFERDTLRGAVNVADRTAKLAGINTPALADWPDLEDGFALHSPVDTLRPNSFGLHHMHGNVWEWCADAYGAYSQSKRLGDGLRHAAAGSGASAGHELLRITRGGCFDDVASAARSSARCGVAMNLRYITLGVRPGRLVQL